MVSAESDATGGPDRSIRPRCVDSALAAGVVTGWECRPTTNLDYGWPVTSELFVIRAARPADVRAIHTLVDPFVRRRLLVAKELIGYYEAVQEFLVAEDADGTVIGCGALHILCGRTSARCAPWPSTPTGGARASAGRCSRACSPDPVVWG